jgi:hypothetical protein
LLKSRASADEWEEITELLKQPNKIDPLTGMPYGWSDENELDGLNALLTD